MPKYRVKRHSVTQPLNKPYRFIPLTQGQNAIVDAEDFEWLSQWNWRAKWNDDTKTFYAHSWRAGWMHRLILGCGIGEEGDHADGNTLNNRRYNLRKCTHSQNQQNKPKQRLARGSSVYKGVKFDGRNRVNQWIARITTNGKSVWIGGFPTPEDAARAYDHKARELHGEFAHLNFP